MLYAVDVAGTIAALGMTFTIGMTYVVNASDSVRQVHKVHMQLIPLMQYVRFRYSW